jgi:hypothetical protein
MEEKLRMKKVGKNENLFNFFDFFDFVVNLPRNGMRVNPRIIKNGVSRICGGHKSILCGKSRARKMREGVFL